MKAILLVTIVAFLSISLFGQNNTEIKTIYDYTVKDINGKDFAFKTLKGKKIMIINTASKCGYTGQFEQLQEIYTKYSKKGFVIVGFPSNDFMNQDPGTNEEILEFCSTNYGVTFPMMEKIRVKGKDMADIYKYLTDENLNGYESSKVKWNFQKYLIDENGYLVKVISTATSPDDEEIIKWIKSKK